MLRKYLAALLCVGTIGWAHAASAGTIIKLSLGGDDAQDIGYSGGILATNSDGNALTTGDQNTNIEYSDFLQGNPDVPLAVASFTMDGLGPSGPATEIAGVLVIQNFSGGTMQLYDAANILLLEGMLADSVLSGPIGAPGTGALFTTSFGTVTGGTLAPLLDPTSLTLSMSLNDVNGGAGFSLSGPVAARVLAGFDADATLSIGAEVPEPAATMLIILSAVTLATASSRRL